MHETEEAFMAPMFLSALQPLNLGDVPASKEKGGEVERGGGKCWKCYSPP